MSRLSAGETIVLEVHYVYIQSQTERQDYCIQLNKELLQTDKRGAKVYGIHILLDQEDWFSSSSQGQSLKVGNIGVINIQAEKTAADIFHTHYQHSYSHQEGKVYISLGFLDIVVPMSIAHTHLCRTSPTKGFLYSLF